LVTRKGAKSLFIHQQADHWNAANTLQGEVERKEAELATIRSSTEERLEVVKAEKAALALRLVEALQ
jgi:hypothetical protein